MAIRIAGSTVISDDENLTLNGNNHRLDGNVNIHPSSGATDEGGQISLKPGSSSDVGWNIDSYQDKFRIFKAGGGGMEIVMDDSDSKTYINHNISITGNVEATNNIHTTDGYLITGNVTNGYKNFGNITVGDGSDITTAEFIEDLCTKGLITSDGQGGGNGTNGPQRLHAVAKVSWNYANNSNISDGPSNENIELAGCWIEVMNDGTSFHIRVTSPMTESGNGTQPQQVYIYNNQTTNYNPGWYKMLTSHGTQTINGSLDIVSDLDINGHGHISQLSMDSMTGYFRLPTTGPSCTSTNAGYMKRSGSSIKVCCCRAYSSDDCVWGYHNVSVSYSSDIRLKTNINHVGISKSGLNIYEWNYISNTRNRYRGVMAQELIKSHPEALTKVNGYYAVNYDKLDVNFRRVN